MPTVTFCNELNDDKIGYPSYVPRATHRFTFDLLLSYTVVACVQTLLAIVNESQGGTCKVCELGSIIEFGHLA